MTIWATTPVDEVPELRLRDWAVYQCRLAGTRHFVGWNITEQEGRVSSAIQAFDAERRRGVTESGRVYELVGEPGRNRDAAYVWARWLRINGETEFDDVTDEVLGELLRAQG
jgi:hypothetical protein